MDSNSDSSSSYESPKTRKARPIFSCLSCYRRRVKASIAPPYVSSSFSRMVIRIPHSTRTKGARLIGILLQCDHLMPCTPCCLRGTPTKCEFTEEGSNAYMLQSELIKNITEECTYLESRLAEMERSGPTSQQSQKGSCKLLALLG